MIGVLALQGGFRAHGAVLEKLGVANREVRTARDLDGLTGLIMPGGESTTMLKLMEAYDLFEPLDAFGRSGRPVLGTCAGSILMARRVVGREQRSFGWLPADIERNAYGCQRESFEATFDCPLWGLRGVTALFIRAPRFVKLGEGVQVLSEWDGSATGVVYGNLTAVAYHPELSPDSRFHTAWLDRFFAVKGLAS